MDTSHLVDHMLSTAVIRRVSDIHIHPKHAEGEILFRIDGSLMNWQSLSKEKIKAVITKFKFIANMDIGETRIPQDGALKQHINDQLIQLRLSTMPTIYGENLVIRLFPQQQKHLSLEQLGLSSQQFQIVINMLHRSQGLLLVTGPTGSGKTTTLYKLLEILSHNRDKHICSLEDPVEMMLPSLTQIQINPSQGLTFAKGLRAVLRQDPDIIFVGEIRDEETAQIAIRASLTGHFVLSTLHTNDAVGATVRLLEMGIKPYYLANALTGIIAQRLYRLKCPYCRNGCYQCFYSRFLGRRGVFECVPIDESLKQIIRLGGDEKTLRDYVSSSKIPSISQQLLRYVSIQLTTESEYLKYESQPTM